MNTDVGLPSAPVDDRTGSQHFDLARLENLHYIAGTASGGDHVFDHHSPVAGPGSEAPAECHLAGGRVSLRENESRAERAGDFMTDDQAAQSRRNHDSDLLGRDLANFIRQHPPQFFSRGWMLQYQGALQILGAMQAGSESKMTLEIRPG